ALKIKYEATNDPEKRRKAKRIEKFNLGRQKQALQQQKVKSTLATEINHAYNQLLIKKPDIIVSEDLSHVFKYKKGKNTNRLLSFWVKGVLKERLEFKALVKGFDHKQVNAA